jgi:hypothetical protein
MEEIEKNDHKPPDELSGYSLNSKYDSPSFIHRILALLPKWLRERDYLYSPIADSIHVSVLYLFVVYLTGVPFLAFLSSMIFAFTPLLLRPDARTFFFSPRPFAELFFSITFISSTLLYLSGSLIYLLSATIFGVFLLYSSKFGTQAFVFLSLGMLVLTWHYALVLGLSFAFAFLSKQYPKVLKGHIRHSNFYRTTIVKSHTGCTQITGIKDILKSFSLKAVFSNPIFISMIFLPFLPFLVLLVLLNPTLTTIQLTLFVWVMVAVGVMLLISTKQLRFLGRAERYLNYAVFPIAVLVPMLHISIFFVAISLFSIFLIAKNHSVASKYFSVSDQEPITSLFCWLKSIPKQRILCAPINASPEVAYKSNHETVYWGGNLPAKNFGSKEWNGLFNAFPYPKRNLTKIVDDFNITMLLVSKRQMDPVFQYDIDGWDMVFKNRHYEAYSKGGEMKDIFGIEIVGRFKKVFGADFKFTLCQNELGNWYIKSYPEERFDELFINGVTNFKEKWREPTTEHTHKPLDYNLTCLQCGDEFESKTMVHSCPTCFGDIPTMPTVMKERIDTVIPSETEIQ